VQVSGGRRGETQAGGGHVQELAVRQGFEPWIQVLARITV
jgi:hypothetical protein